MYERPTIWDFVWIGLLAAFLWGIHSVTPETPGDFLPGLQLFFRVMTGLGAVVLGVADLIVALMLAVRKASDMYYEVRRANAITKESELARSLRDLTAESQRFLLDRFQLHIERHLGKDGRVVDKLGPTGVPMDWVVGIFIPHSDSVKLAAVGKWSEGTLNREYAVKTTNYFIDLGIAIRDYKSQQAQWAPDASPAMLLDAFGYSLEMTDVEL